MKKKVFQSSDHWLDHRASYLKDSSGYVEGETLCLHSWYTALKTEHILMQPQEYSLGLSWLLT